ncbi:MAG TPA: polysaccharide biosynthesis/export family protein [Thermoanaerobaculia bacterium]|nr:polysaccharide biosynthesis/export family protein [Thermoanaerobaculia bacterium]
MKRLRFFSALSLCLALALRAPAEDKSSEYRLGPKDLLEIKVLEIPELNVERRVADNGSVTLPLLGDFPVQGLTAAEVRDHLEALLKEKFVNRADVSIIVKDFANKPVSILGAVLHPGSLNISGRWFLLQAISAAGGVTEAAGRKIYVLRRSDNGLSDTLEVSTDDLFRNASQMWNIPIYPSDVVNIPARSTIRIFCIGEVKAPGAVEFSADDRITLLSVLAKAGGLTDRASKTIRIKRRDASGRDVETVVDYKRVLSGKDVDPALKADDVVVIKESFF